MRTRVSRNAVSDTRVSSVEPSSTTTTSSDTPSCARAALSAEVRNTPHLFFVGMITVTSGVSFIDGDDGYESCRSISQRTRG